MRITTSLLLCVVLAAPAAAEGFFDLYVGGAFTRDDGARDFEDSALAGIRGGIWGEGDLPFLGAALDISGFSPDGENRFQGADLAVVPISALLMARLPLVTSSDFPTGQIHPYVGVGPSLVVSHLDVPAFSPAGIPLGGGIDDVAADLGLDVRGGVDAILTQHVGIFVEYRYLHFEPHYRDGGRALGLDFDTHFVQGGVTFRF